MDDIEYLVDMVLLEDGEGNIRMDRATVRSEIEKDIRILEAALVAQEKSKLRGPANTLTIDVSLNVLVVSSRHIPGFIQ